MLWEYSCQNWKSKHKIIKGVRFLIILSFCSLKTFFVEQSEQYSTTSKKSTDQKVNLPKSQPEHKITKMLWLVFLASWLFWQVDFLVSWLFGGWPFLLVSTKHYCYDSTIDIERKTRLLKVCYEPATCITF